MSPKGAADIRDININHNVIDIVFLFKRKYQSI